MAPISTLAISVVWKRKRSFAKWILVSAIWTFGDNRPWSPDLIALDFCYECLDGDYDIANVLRPNSDYWASNLKEDDDNVPVDIILNLRASYQLSGFYIELGSGLIPEKIEIFKMFEGDTEVFPLHVIDFTGSCRTPDFIDSGGVLK